MDFPTRAAVELKLKELELDLGRNLQYRLETLFPQLTGFFISRQIRKKCKQIQKIEPVLRQILLPGEQVCALATGTMSIFGSQPNVYVVFTFLRVVLIDNDEAKISSEAFWHINYDQIKKISTTWTECLKLNLLDGTTCRIDNLSKTERAVMTFLVEESRTNYARADFTSEVSQSRENLCPHCYHVVTKNQYECEECGATFYTPIEMAQQSFAFPGIINFKNRRYLAAAAELLLFLSMGSLALFALMNNQPVYTYLILTLAQTCFNSIVAARNANRRLTLKCLPEFETI